MTREELKAVCERHAEMLNAMSPVRIEIEADESTICFVATRADGRGLGNADRLHLVFELLNGMRQGNPPPRIEDKLAEAEHAVTCLIRMLEAAKLRNDAERN